MILICLTCFPACTSTPLNRDPDNVVEPIEPWDLNNYSKFVEQNMRELNNRYSEYYVTSHFIVDTDSGSIKIQDLIRPDAVEHILKYLNLGRLDEDEKLTKIYQYVLNNYIYIPEPSLWNPVEDTLKLHKGDCKNLSLLLLSLLISSGFDAYAAISNNHMWVCVILGKKFRVLETDRDAERMQIYNIPGFYDLPLYKIYFDRVLKRKIIP